MKSSSTITFRVLSAGEWALAALLAGNLAWTSPHLGGVRAETMAASWLLTGAALALHLLLAALSGERPRWSGVGVLLAAFLVCAAANVRFVTPVRWLGVRDWLGWAQMIAVFWVAWRGLRRAGPRGLLLGVAVMLGLAAAVLCAYQSFVNPGWLMMGRAQMAHHAGRASGFFGNPNSMAAFFVLLIPPLLALAWQRGAGAGRRLACGGAAAMMLAGWVLTLSRGGWLALAAALAAWPLLARGRKWRGRLWRSGAALAAFAAAGAGLYVASPAVRARVDKFVEEHGERSRPILWMASLRLAAGSPVFGAGAGSFGVLFERERPEGFRGEPQWAHNEFFNTLGEHGAAGLLLFFGAAGAVTWRLLRARRAAGGAEHLSSGCDDWRAPEITRAIGAGLLALGLACWLDFHLKIPAVAMLAAVLAAEGWRRVADSAAPAPAPAKTGAPGTVSAALAKARAALGKTLAKARAALPTLPVPPVPAAAARRVVIVAKCLAAFAVMLFVTLKVAPFYRAEAARAGARAQIDALATGDHSPADILAHLHRTQQLLTRAAVISPAGAGIFANPQIFSDLSYHAALLTRIPDADAGAIATLGKRAEQAARDALAQSDAVYEFWIRLGVALDVQGRWDEAGEAFTRALELAPASALAWYHQAYHMALNPSAHSQAIIFIETCLRLDPGYESARVLLAHLRANS
jgi:hypothetical protein